MKKNLIMIVDQEGYRKVLKQKGFLFRNYQEIKILTLASGIKERLKSNFGTSIYEPFDLIDRDTNIYARNTAFYLSHNWFRNKDGKDIFEIDGISFGLIPQVYLYTLFYEVFVYLEALTRMIEQRKNIECIVAAPKHKRFISDILKATNINCKIKSLGNIRVSNYFYMFSIENIIEYLKKNHFDWQVKMIVSLFQSLLWRKKVIGKVDDLLIYDVYNKPAIESLFILQEHLIKKGRKCAGLFFEGRVFNLVPNILQKIFLASYLNLTVFFNGRKTYEILRKQYKSNLKMIRNNFIYKNKSVYILFKEELNKLIRNFYSQLFREYVVFERVFRELKPRNVLVASDSHKMSRLSVLMARKYNINSVTLQHGAPVDYCVYTPVFADKVAVWGEYAKSWFIRHGVSAEKVSVTGQPRFDKIYKKKEQFVVTKETLNMKKILFVVSGISDSFGKYETIRSLNILNNILQKVNNYKLIIKLHPGEKETQFIKDIMDSLNFKNFTITRNANLYNLIIDSSVVITTFSTVGIEALMFDKPLIIIESNLAGFRLPYGEYNCAFSVNNAEDLQRILVKDLFCQDIVEAKRLNAKKFLRDYIYTVGNRALENITKLLH